MLEDEGTLCLKAQASASSPFRTIDSFEQGREGDHCEGRALPESAPLEAGSSE